ncbi:hypothetical protein ACFOHW_12690 [Paenibacillus abyssi]
MNLEQCPGLLRNKGLNDTDSQSTQDNPYGLEASPTDSNGCG